MSPVAIAAAVLGALLAAFLGGYHYRGQTEELKAQSAQLRQEAANQIQAGRDESHIQQEASTYHAALTDPLPAVPVVSVCVDTPAMPAPLATGAGADARPQDRAVDQLPRAPAPNIGPGLLRAGHVGDAQVRALQDYILRVCLAQ